MQGDGTVARTAKFESMAEIEKSKKDLQAVVKEWIRMQDRE